MSQTSTFEIPCLCGALVRSESREALCAECGRMLVVEWGREPRVQIGNYNLWQSAMAETIALAPIAPWTEEDAEDATH